MIGIKIKKPRYGEEMLRSIKYALKYGNLIDHNFSRTSVISKFSQEQITHIHPLIIQLDQQINSGDDSRIIDAIYSLYHLIICAPFILSFFEEPRNILNTFLIALQNNLVPPKIPLHFFMYLIEKKHEEFGELILENDEFLPIIISKLPAIDSIKILDMLCQLYEPVVEFCNQINLIDKLFLIYRKFLSKASLSICIEILNFIDHNFDSFNIDLKQIIFFHMLKFPKSPWETIIQRAILLFANHLDKTIDYLIGHNLVFHVLNIINKPGFKLYYPSVFTLLQFLVDFSSDSFSGLAYLMENNIGQYLAQMALKYEDEEINDFIFDLINNLIYHDQDIITNGIYDLFTLKAQSHYEQTKLYEMKLNLFHSDNPTVLQYVKEFDPLPEVIDFLESGTQPIIQSTLEIILGFLQSRPNNWAFSEIQEISQQEAFYDILNKLNSSQNETIKELTEEILSILEDEDEK